jgi:hypothetical protein
MGKLRLEPKAQHNTKWKRYVRDPGRHLVRWTCPITGSEYHETVVAIVGEELMMHDPETATVLLVSWMGRNRAELSGSVQEDRP